ncbi:isocitrate dehydrogenase [NAD] catalytic subunit 5, mitochondrial-like [Arachis hypogaea]|uniref:isocitrate dehydrogenase [NAD] catalytic subunit 5, mitochondrial-like n=1 Tax=Arachis hypogaea TaxID=3818 RepID=UPI003B228F27
MVDTQKRPENTCRRETRAGKSLGSGEILGTGRTWLSGSDPEVASEWKLYQNRSNLIFNSLVGGLGLTASYKIGEGGIALAEAVHGSAPDIAGKNLANPTALLLSCVSILRHLNLHDKADQIQNAILNTIAEGKYRTADLGGKARTTEFTNAIIDHL